MWGSLEEMKTKMQTKKKMKKKSATRTATSTRNSRGCKWGRLKPGWAGWCCSLFDLSPGALEFLSRVSDHLAYDGLRVLSNHVQSGLRPEAASIFTVFHAARVEMLTSVLPSS